MCCVRIFEFISFVSSLILSPEACLGSVSSLDVFQGSLYPLRQARLTLNSSSRHSHSIYGRSFCTLGRKLDIITQDACSFYNVRLTFPSYSDGFTDSLDRTTSSTQPSTALSWPVKKAKTLHVPWETKKPLFSRITAC